MGDGTEPFALDDASWQSYCETAMSELHQDERAALLRVATGTATKADAVLLAASLMHSDLFESHATVIRCAYCGKEMPDGCPHPNVFSCCGEVGHFTEDQE